MVMTMRHAYCSAQSPWERHQQVTMLIASNLNVIAYNSIAAKESSLLIKYAIFTFLRRKYLYHDSNLTEIYSVWSTCPTEQQSMVYTIACRKACNKLLSENTDDNDLWHIASMRDNVFINMELLINRLHTTLTAHMTVSLGVKINTIENWC